MARAHSSNLRQVRDADDLSVLLAHLLHDASHLLGNTARHARVDFVEDDSRQFHLAGNESLQRKHHAGNLAARCHLLHGLQRRVLVRTEQEFHRVGTRRSEPFRVHPHIHLELHIRHTERNEGFHHSLLHVLGSFLSLLRQFFRHPHGFLLRRRHLLPQFLNHLLAVVDEHESLAELSAERDEFLHAIHLVLLLQRVECGKAFLHLLQSLWQKLYVVGFLTDFVGYVLHLDVARLHAVRQFLSRLHLVADAAQGSHRRLHLLQQRFLSLLHVFATIDASHCVRQLLLDFLGMFQQFRLLLQSRLLAFHELRLLQLVELESQVVLVVLALLCPFDGISQRLLSLSQRMVLLLVVRQSVSILRHRVEDVQLEVLLAEQEVLMLRMDVDESFTQFLQGGEAHRRVVDKGTALACTRQFAPDDALRSVEIKVVLLEEIAHTILTYVEFCFHHTALCPSLNRLGVGSLSAQQPDSSQNDALSGSRFACDD